MNTKQLLLATAITLFSVVAHAQSNASDAQQFQRDFVSAKTSNTYPLFTSGEKQPTSFNEEKYRKFKKMRTNGIILTGIGAGLITGGVVLVAIGAKDNHNDGYWDGDYYYESSDGKIIAGALGIVFGTLSTGGGITMWVIGNNKMKKYGGGEISLQSNKNGLGVAYRF
ncbi:MAG TPA: hypothetical protein PKE30_07765 [Niabella sp.]|nr:hypothetical protein [Niabella sp.]